MPGKFEVWFISTTMRRGFAIRKTLGKEAPGRWRLPLLNLRFLILPEDDFLRHGLVHRTLVKGVDLVIRRNFEERR